MDVFFWLGFVFVFFVIGILIAHKRATKVKKEREEFIERDGFYRKTDKEIQHHITAKSVAIETIDGTNIVYSGNVELYYEVPK